VIDFSGTGYIIMLYQAFGMDTRVNDMDEAASVSRRQPDPFKAVAQDLSEVELLLKKELSSEAALILDVSRYLFNSGGKRFRPALHLLSAHLVGLENGVKYKVAAAIECVHTATLLHDDVVDNATIRRGKPSANVVWGDHASVLVGDFLFTTAVKWILETGDMALTRRVAETCTKMAEGEAFQMKSTYPLKPSEEEYLHVVRLKTAGLISLSCYSAAMLAGLDGNIYESLQRFGHGVGMAFQVVDDALDYCSDADELGKALGKDLEEGKVTLPLLHALGKADRRDRKVLESILSSRVPEPADFARAQEIINRTRGVEYAIDRAREMVEGAKKSLKTFEPSPSREALLELADFTVTRNK